MNEIGNFRLSNGVEAGWFGVGGGGLGLLGDANFATIFVFLSFFSSFNSKSSSTWCPIGVIVDFLI